MSTTKAKTKTVTVSSQEDAKAKIRDIEFVGGDLFKLLSKASSQEEGWMKSTKAMEVPGGCVVQVTTLQRNPDGSFALAEALTFVPTVRLVDDENGGRRLAAH